MNLVIKKEIAQRIGYDAFAKYGVQKSEFSTWRETQDIDMSKLSNASLDDLEALLTRFKNVRGVAVLINDIKMWKSVLTEGATAKRARTVRQFEPLLVQHLLHVPGHRIYKKHDEGIMLAYVVTHIEYHPPHTTNSGKIPARVEMGLAYSEIGGRTKTHVSFDSDDCLHIPVGEALAAKGYIIEDDFLREDYLTNHARYEIVANQIGKQFWGRGYAYTVNDRSYDSKTTQLDRFGEPARVLVDVFKEDGKADNGNNYVELHPFFWPNVEKKGHYDPETDTDTSMAEDENTVFEQPQVEVPTHPWLIVFHLAKHLRLRCHVGQLDEYVYDTNIADKLVLPRDQKALVKLLIDTKGGAFVDIVAGKGGGAVVLLTGEPGVGKTLTAEVYAESEERALYSVQCSQLGTKPEELESALMTVFARARRWNAVLLLDEADVYVHQRGDSMQQNAIVGVFLRVLEYQGSTLFLTSNRPDDVDDAIASRCIARLHYAAPEADDAERIWKVLSENAGIPISEYVVHQTVEANPGMTGRDIKNILKLASLMHEGESVSFQDIEYVKQFKPTGKIMDRVKSREQVHIPMPEMLVTHPGMPRGRGRPRKNA